ncbi:MULTISPECIES: AAA family ATPase [Pseudomonas]|uniref:AAA family ATPase n=1 Tax=Pseudomonas TaxID=286 RepID=UPI0018E89B34|nr:AAA family ATPase [Pseudomonas carnis]
MIYSFGARNYFSFKDSFEVSFELNSKVPKAISQGKKASNILGIKGANASGKTNILKSLQFLSHFATRSFKSDPNQKITLSGFFLIDEPSDFYIDFEYNGIRYTYELTVNQTEVIREAIYKKVARKTLILERSRNTIKMRTTELAPLELVTLRSNASIIDTTAHYKMKNIGTDISNVHSFFSSFKGNVSSSTVISDTTLYDYNKISEFYKNNEDALNFAKRIICNSDLGIKDIIIHSRQTESDETVYFPIFHHHIIDNADTEKDYKWLTYWDESDGTTALFRRLSQYWRVLNVGGVLIMDEFDTNYHPDLLPQILDLFLSNDSNPSNAQFIFTSHNLQIMDYLGKYRTYLTSKENGQSFCYRLDEIPGDIIRNERSISALYRDGKLGGVPKI